MTKVTTARFPVADSSASDRCDSRGRGHPRSQRRDGAGSTRDWRSQCGCYLRTCLLAGFRPAWLRLSGVELSPSGKSRSLPAAAAKGRGSNLMLCEQRYEFESHSSSVWL
jgi:hypothetical protein